MKQKLLSLLVLGLIVLYPILTLFQLDQVISTASDLQLVEERLVNYELSIWISWVFMVCLAVYFKWTKKRNLIFIATYGFLFISFSIFGTYTQLMFNIFDIPSSFKDGYTLGIFTAIQKIVISGSLTGFLQAGVWWFTRRWNKGR